MKWHSAAICTRQARWGIRSCTRAGRPPPARLPSLVLIAQLPPAALPLSTSSAAVGWRAG
jgi:hypothetical protein